MDATSLVEDYLNSAVLRLLTVYNYRVAARMLCVHLGRDPEIEDVSDKQLVTFREAVLARSSAATFNHYRRHLSALFRYAVRRDYLECNPLEHVRGAPVTRRRPKTIDRDLLDRAIAHLNDPFDSQGMAPGWFWIIMLRMLSYTGMRRRQLLSLCWCDIDLDTLTVRFRVEGRKTYREWYIPLARQIVPDLMRLKCDRPGLDAPSVLSGLSVASLCKATTGPQAPGTERMAGGSIL